MQKSDFHKHFLYFFSMPFLIFDNFFKHEEELGVLWAPSSLFFFFLLFNLLLLPAVHQQYARNKIMQKMQPLQCATATGATWKREMKLVIW